MFAVHCPTHDMTVLLSTESIRAVESTAEGIIVTLECYDGTTLTVVTGRNAAA